MHVPIADAVGMRTRRLGAATLLVFAALLAAACQSDGDDNNNNTPANGNDQQVATETPEPNGNGDDAGGNDGDGNTQGSDNPQGSDSGSTLQDIAASAIPSVVRIGTNCQDALATQCVGIGSGWAYDDEGHVVTNNHVIVLPQGGGVADTISVSTNDGRVLEAELVGRDPASDLAVLRVPELGADSLPLAEPGETEIGEPVAAIGFALDLGASPSVTTGVISAFNRIIREQTGGILGALQTDAAINPGNSGGPLINGRGLVVGVNTAGIQGTEGIGFAVSSEMVRAVTQQILETGDVQRAYLGVIVREVTPALAEEAGLETEEGVVILSLEQGAPASDAGLQPGDVITSVAGMEVTIASDVQLALIGHGPNGTIDVTRVRDGESETVEVPVESPPEQ